MAKTTKDTPKTPKAPTAPRTLALGPCRWFASCENIAVTVQPHPVLGDVPICQRCLDWYARMSR